MLTASRFYLQIKGKCILQNIDLAVQPAEVLAVVGPNGAGKSSICRILSGEIAPSSGEVSMNGRPLRDWSRREQAKMRAILPQQSSRRSA